MGFQAGCNSKLFKGSNKGKYKGPGPNKEMI